MTITIVSLLEQVLYINLLTHTDYNFFSNLFESNDRKEILKIQTANKEFKSRLKIFNEVSRSDKKCLTMRAVFEDIPENSKFIVVASKIDDAILLYSLKQEVDKLNGVNIPSNLDNTKYQIASLYYTQSFNGDTKRRHYIGELNKSNRICRFCGNQTPAVSFNHTSHAISESLGNKSIICREECDNCNERFSRTIEPDIANMLSPLLTIYSIHGKKGIRTTSGKNFKLSLDESPKSNDANDGTVKLQLNQEFPDNIEEFLKNKLSLDASSLKYIPQNVYKCLCKYVVSVINERYLPDFTKTIDWINSATKYCKLPLIAIGNGQIKTNTPYMIVSIRKTNNYNYPYCYALFIIANMAFAFIVPFTSKDKYQFITSTKYTFFQEMILSWCKGFKWSFNKLSSSKKTYTRFDFTLQIPPECKLGKDYFIIDTNQ